MCFLLSKGSDSELEQYRVRGINEIFRADRRCCFILRMSRLLHGMYATVHNGSRVATYLPDLGTQQTEWISRVKELTKCFPTELWLRDGLIRKIRPIKFCTTDGKIGTICEIKRFEGCELDMSALFIEPDPKTLSTFGTKQKRFSFLRPNQKYETVSKSPISETRIVNFPNLNKGYKYETREYSPKRIEQEAKQKSEGIIRLEKYIGETYYVCNGIGHKVKEETSANQTLLGQNNISNIYNLKMSKDKTIEEYSPRRVKRELRKKGKVLTLERDTYETHYIHGGENNLVKREVAERVRSLSKSPIQCRHY